MYIQARSGRVCACWQVGKSWDCRTALTASYRCPPSKVAMRLRKASRLHVWNANARLSYPTHCFGSDGRIPGRPSWALRFCRDDPQTSVVVVAFKVPSAFGGAAEAYRRRSPTRPGDGCRRRSAWRYCNTSGNSSGSRYSSRELRELEMGGLVCSYRDGHPA